MYPVLCAIILVFLQAKRELNKEYDKQLEKIDVTKGNIAKDLMKKVHTTDVKECSPRTVCGCRLLEKHENGVIIKTYTAICHDDCTVKNIPAEEINVEDLKLCWALNGLEGNRLGFCRVSYNLY